MQNQIAAELGCVNPCDNGLIPSEGAQQQQDQRQTLSSHVVSICEVYLKPMPKQFLQIAAELGCVNPWDLELLPSEGREQQQDQGQDHRQSNRRQLMPDSDLSGQAAQQAQGSMQPALLQGPAHPRFHKPQALPRYVCTLVTSLLVCYAVHHTMHVYV